MFIKRFLKRISEGGLKQYIKYSLGEILLLVAGILIALQINNWNENRKEDNKLDSILHTIKNDLIQDTSEVAYLIKVYEDEMAVYDTVFNNLGGPEYIYDHSSWVYHHVNEAALEINSRGYHLLKNYNSNHQNIYDTLVNDLDELYAVFISNNKSMFTGISESVSNSLNFYRDNKSWYEEYLSDSISRETIQIIYTDQRCRNQMFHYRLLIRDNYIRLLKAYKRNIIHYLDEIEKRLDKR
jgi:hypothetical protein